MSEKRFTIVVGRRCPDEKIWHITRHSYVGDRAGSEAIVHIAAHAAVVSVLGTLLAVAIADCHSIRPMAWIQTPRSGAIENAWRLKPLEPDDDLWLEFVTSVAAHALADKGGVA